MDLAESWGEFKVTERVLTMADLTKGLKEKRVSKNKHWSLYGLNLLNALERTFFVM